jgi:tetratricopeptide (TPR) repeat protein
VKSPKSIVKVRFEIGAFLFVVCLVAMPARGISQVAETRSDDPTGQLADFADEIERAVADGDEAALAKLIDQESLINRAVDGLNLTLEERRGFHDGVLKGIKESGGLLGAVSKQVEKGGDYSLVRLSRQGDNFHLLFRLVQPEGQGLNHHDHLLRKQADGSYRIIDTKVAVSGESFSETIRRGALGIVAERTRKPGEKIPPEAEAFLSASPVLRKAQALNEEGEAKEALDLIEGLPPDVRQTKLVLINKILVSSQVDEATYRRAIEEFRAAFPGDPAADYHGIDGFTLAKRWEEALACLDRVDKSLGGDPYFDCLRANLLTEKGDLAGAREAAARAMEALPDRLEPYWAAIGVALAQKDFGRTLALLKQLDETFEIEWDDLTKEETYAEFVKSPEYAEWTKYLKEQETDPEPAREPAAGA